MADSLPVHNKRLPPELIDRIIDYLHGDFPNLRACALVCKAWLPSCRFHLFYHVHIDSQPYGPLSLYPIRRLHDIIQQSPRVALHVRELSVTTRAPSRGPMNPEIARILSFLLRSFAQLRKLILCYAVWDWFTLEVKKSFTDILNLPSLIHFETDHASFSELEHFTTLLRPHLKYLIVDIEWRNNRTTEEISNAVDREVGQVKMVKRRQCRIERLEIGMSCQNPNFAKWLLGPQSVIDSSNLHTFGISYSHNEALATVRLIRSLESSLESLVITPGLDFLGSGGIIGEGRDIFCLGHLRNLQTLSVYIALKRETASYLRLVLSNVIAPKLQHIHLDVFLDRCHTPEWSHWEEVDSALKGPAFDSLRSMKIVLQSYDSYDDNIGTFCEEFVKHFPLVTSRGILEVVGKKFFKRVWHLPPQRRQS